MENKNKIGIIAIIVVLVLMFIVFTGGFLYTISLLNKTKAATENTQVQEVEPEYELKDVVKIPIPDSITVNLLPGKDNKKHIAVVKVQIGLNSKDKEFKKLKLETLVTENITVIRDSIIGILRNKTYEELEKPDSIAMLKQEILSSLQEMFGTNAIVEVFFDEFNHQ